MIEQGEKSLHKEFEKPKDCSAVSLPDLISYINERHNRQTKPELARLKVLLSELCARHAKPSPELGRIRSLFQDLDQRLLIHLIREQALYPYISCMDGVKIPMQEGMAQDLEAVRNKIIIIMREHEKILELLFKIRAASSNFTLPHDACIGHRVLYKSLQEFEQHLLEDMRLENEFLFSLVPYIDIATPLVM